MFDEQNSRALLASTYCHLVLRSSRECMCNSRGAPGDGFMKIRFSAVVLAATLACSSLATAQAQNAARVYDNGPVWTVAYIETKPGMLNDYMAYIAGPYAALQEAAKKRGEVLDYKVLSVDSPRDNEPNLILMVQFKNMGVFDRSLAEGEKDDAAVFGSLAGSRQSQVKRQDMRVLRGEVLTRELRFIK